MRRLVLAVLLALVGSVVLAGPASAHASLIGTDPTEGQVLATAPSEATFTFDEPVRSQPDGVHVFNAAGEELPTDSKTTDTKLVVDLPAGLSDGSYVIAWRVISTDGHPVAGALTFAVGAPSLEVVAPDSVVSGTSRAVQVGVAVTQSGAYLGVFLAAGLVVFLILLLPRIAGLDETRGRLRLLARRAAVLGAVSSYLLLVVSALYRSGEGFGTSDASSWVPDPGLTETWAAALLIVAVLVSVRFVDRPPIALAAAAAALGTLPAVGHTRAFGPAWLVVSANLLHVLAGAVWLGGLVGLAISLPRLADRPRSAAETLVRFSTLAAGLLAAVAITGSILGWRILRSWSALWETDFGITLLVKLGLVVLVVALAAANRFRLLPAVTAEVSHADRGRAAARLRRAVRAEAVLLVGVLAVTGVLVDRSPVPSGSGAVPGPAGLDSSTHVGQAPGLRVVLQITPGRIGPNEVLLQIQDEAQNPIEPYAVPALSFSRGGVDLGDQALTPIDSGTYTATVVLPQDGDWTADVVVRTGEFDSRVVPVAFQVRSGVTPAVR